MALTKREIKETGRKCRLKSNLIFGDKFHPRGEVVLDSVVPAKFLTPEFISYDLDHREGSVMCLWRELTVPGPHGPRTIRAGETFSLESIDPRIRDLWHAGEHYLVDWSPEDVARTMATAEEEELKGYSMDDLRMPEDAKRELETPEQPVTRRIAR